MSTAEDARMEGEPMMFAVDPGTVESAWIEYADGVIGAHGKEENHAVLRRISALDRDVSVVIEMVASYGMAVGREVFETVLWTGRFLEAAKRPVRLLYRAEVKSHLCHSQKAKDGNIRQALIDKLGPPGTKKSPGGTYGISGDRWAALGVAVTAVETPPSPGSVRGGPVT